MTLLSAPLRIWRDRVLKTLGTALLFAAGLAITSDPAFAIQTIVTQVDKNADGSMTYHFAVKLDQGETLTPGASKETTADFVHGRRVSEVAAWLGVLVRGLRPH